MITIVSSFKDVINVTIDGSPLISVQHFSITIHDHHSWTRPWMAHSAVFMNIECWHSREFTFHYLSFLFHSIHCLRRPCLTLVIHVSLTCLVPRNRRKHGDPTVGVRMKVSSHQQPPLAMQTTYYPLFMAVARFKVVLKSSFKILFRSSIIDKKNFILSMGSNVEWCHKL